jgi:DNA-binding CsgD family transcriptional regulator/PAS domain-containing protein
MRRPFSSRRPPPDCRPGGAPLGAVLDAIYNTVDAQGTWGRALEAVGTHLGVQAALLALGEDGQASAAVTASWNVSETAITACSGPMIAGDPLVMAAVESPQRVFLASPPSALTRLVLSQGGSGQSAGVLLLRPPGKFAFLWLFRDSEAAAFDAGGEAELAPLVHHLRHAITLQQRLRRTEHRLELLTATFDRIALGAVIVDVAGRPVMVNKVAARIAGTNGGFGLSAEGLRCATKSDTARLQELLKAVVTGGERTGSVGLRLPRRGEGRPFELIVVPLPGERLPDSAAAVVFITDPERHHLTPERLLCDLYGMTGAEARLALRLTLGESLTEAADSLSISRNTAHSQLDSIFLKTDTHSQVELVRLLHRGPVATRPYEDSAHYRRGVPG